MIMQGKEYQDLAMRTNDRKGTERLEVKVWENYYQDKDDNMLLERDGKDIGGVFNACLGLSGEVGEFNDMIKKAQFEIRACFTQRRNLDIKVFVIGHFFSTNNFG